MNMPDMAYPAWCRIDSGTLIEAAGCREVSGFALHACLFNVRRVNRTTNWNGASASIGERPPLAQSVAEIDHLQLKESGCRRPDEYASMATVFGRCCA
jgi:hypothetical protein